MIFQHCDATRGNPWTILGSEMNAIYKYGRVTRTISVLFCLMMFELMEYCSSANRVVTGQQ